MRVRRLRAGGVAEPGAGEPPWRAAVASRVRGGWRRCCLDEGGFGVVIACGRVRARRVPGRGSAASGARGSGCRMGFAGKVVRAA